MKNIDYKEYYENSLKENKHLQDKLFEIQDILNENTLFPEDMCNEIRSLLDLPKRIEKMKCHAFGDKDENGNYVMSALPTNEEFMNKINEIIDNLNNLKSKGE